LLTTLFRLFRLKPYGNQLIDGMAELWLVLAAVNIASIAICDAIAWAYFGYTTGHGIAAYVAAALAGVIVFMLVGSLDAMFVMHDRTRGQHTKLAFAARVVLVILTFTVTAPFLTQLVFTRDIEANIARQNEQRIASRRAQIANGFDQRVDAARTRLTGRQRDLEKEIAGRGASGLYGKGPTAAAIESEVAQLQSDIAGASGAKTAELRAFDVAPQRYGVDVVREGPDTRARAVAELEQAPSFRATQRTIKAFLIFMFLGLVCLKLFQPESVRIYYSASLQSGYTRLKAGVFDSWLDKREHGEMTPVRFADWYENDQQVRDVTDRLRDQTALAIERLKAQEDAVHVLHETLQQDITRLHASLATAVETGDTIEQHALSAEQELAALNARIAEEQQALEDFRYDVASDLSLRDQQLLIASRSKTLRSLDEHRAQAARVTASLTRLRHRLEATRTFEQQLRTSLDAAGTEAAALTQALQTARQRRLADILAAT
jgi:flagellar biosynthesis protein FliQ